MDLADDTDVKENEISRRGSKKFEALARSLASRAHVASKQPPKDRVMYPRKQKLCFQKVPVTGGVPITEEQAIALRQVVFGTQLSSPRGEWLRTGMVFRDADQEMSYGLKASKNSTRGLLTVVQAYIIKILLFDKRNKDNNLRPEVILKPSRTMQIEALWTTLGSILWHIGEKTRSLVCLPKDIVLIPHGQRYFQDGLTEKLHIFEFTNLEDLQIFIKRYLYLFMEEPGYGCLLLLYSAILTRGVTNIHHDLENDRAFLVTAAEEGSECIVTLLLTGRATPYLHNGVIYVGDEDHYALPHFGVLSRCEVGFLLWEENVSGGIDESRQPGSRLKTPSLPVWVCSYTGHYGVIFNTNKELLRNYHAERRFDLYYYSCGGNVIQMTVDTRFAEDEHEQVQCKEEGNSLMLERLVHTKWQEARIYWVSGNMQST